MLSSEFSEGEDQWANFQQTQEEPITLNPLIQYENSIASISLNVDINKIDPKVLKHHRIMVTHNTHISNIFNVYEKDCYITIKKKHHFGTHCVYDVVIANFTLEIHVLNLHRSSDQRDSDLSQSQLGSGGFGSVRRVQAGENIFAIKRINFQAKAEGIDGFDIETQNAECKQIQKAIRQYCLYKICSMLRIGPEVIFQSNYDLICFNNCIEFLMELCQNPNKQANMLQMNLSYQKLQQDLLQNMKLLHSLHIIHKDIKPQNILYSQSLEKFVFTDFGVTHAVKEDYLQKTFTNFAGTIEYCSEEMKQLLSTGNGHVNLYLNDFEGLKKTISKFRVEVSKSSSLSRNAMSFNNNSENQIGSFSRSHEDINSIHNSYEQWFENELSSSHKSSENIYIKSTHSLDAPYKLASEINYYQSQILYQLFTTYESHTHQLTSLQVTQVISKYSLEINDEFIVDEVKRYILSIIFPSESSAGLILKIIDLKNTARNYGPKDEQTLQKLDQVLAENEVKEKEQVLQYFQNLRKALIDDTQTIQIHKFSKEIALHLYLKNYNYLIGCCIRILREAVRYKLQQNQNPNKKISIDLSFICKLYILCHKLNVLTISQSKTLNSLFLSVWQEHQIADLQQYIKTQSQSHNYSGLYTFSQNPVSARITNKLIRHAMNYMVSSSAITSFEIIQALSIFIDKFQSINLDDFNYFEEQFKKFTDTLYKITISQANKENNYSLMLEIVKLFRKICKIEIMQKIKKLQLIKQMEQVNRQFKELQDKKYYFSCVIQLIWIYFQMQLYDTCKKATQVLKDLEQYSCPEIQKFPVLIQLNSIIGCSYLKKDELEESLVYLRIAEKNIITFYGVENLALSYYQCINNISLIYYKQNKLDEALNSYLYLLKYVKRTKKECSFEKCYLLCIILTIRLEIGITRQNYPQIEELIKSMIYQTIFTVISRTLSDKDIQKKLLGPYVLSCIQVTVPEHKIFVMKTFLKYIEDYTCFFMTTYEQINYDLNKIYVKQLKKPSLGLPYIWNYIKVKIKDFHNVTREDFMLMNDFISNLIKINSSRRALIIIKKYIFHIPLTFYEERKQAFRLFHKIHFNIGHPFQKISCHLIARDCQTLSSRNFSKIYRKQVNSFDKLTNLLLKKWLERI